MLSRTWFCSPLSGNIFWLQENRNVIFLNPWPFYPPSTSIYLINILHVYKLFLVELKILSVKYFFLNFKQKTIFMKAWLCNMPSLQKLLKISLVPILLSEKNLQRLYFISSCFLPVLLLPLPLISQGASYSSASQLQLMITIRYLTYGMTNKLWGRCTF